MNWNKLKCTCQVHFYSFLFFLFQWNFQLFNYTIKMKGRVYLHPDIFLLFWGPGRGDMISSMLKPPIPLATKEFSLFCHSKSTLHSLSDVMFSLIWYFTVPVSCQLCNRVPDTNYTLNKVLLGKWVNVCCSNLLYDKPSRKRWRRIIYKAGFKPRFWDGIVMDPRGLIYSRVLHYPYVTSFLLIALKQFYSEHGESVSSIKMSTPWQYKWFTLQFFMNVATPTMLWT